MTISLRTNGRRFETMFKTEAGLPFMATLQPLNEGEVASYDFSEPRHILRVRHDCVVSTGTILVHPNGSRYLMADHDDVYLAGTNLYRTHRLFLMNKQMEWRRETTTVDPLTQLAKSTGSEPLATIWILLEQNGREQMDLTLRQKEEVHRVITNADLQLNDMLDKRVVKRVDRALGVTLAEIQ